MSLVSVDEFRKNVSENSGLTLYVFLVFNLYLLRNLISKQHLKIKSSADEKDIPSEAFKKAYKTSHRKNHATADLRESLREPDPSKPWRVESIGRKNICI